MRNKSLIPILLLATPMPAPAQVATTSIRKIEFLAPAETFVFVRARRLPVDLPRFYELASRLLGKGGPIAALMRPHDARKADAFMRLARGFERNAVGAAIREMSRGEVAFGARLSGGKPRPYLIARLASADAARRVVRPFARTFRLPALARGRFAYLAPDGATRTALEAAIDGSRRGQRSQPIAYRIAREIPNRSLAAWLDLRETQAGRYLAGRLTLLPGDPNAGLVTAGLGQAIARAGSVVASASLGWSRVAIELRVPRARDQMSKSTRQALALDSPPFRDVPELAGTIARFRIGRDLAGVIANRKKLASSLAQDEFQGFLSTLEMFFRGADVERDILPELAPGIRGVVTLPRRAPKTLPDRLPTGAVVFDLREEGRLAQTVEGALQVIITVANNDRQRAGKLPFRLRIRKEDGVRVGHTTMKEPEAGRPWPIDRVFAPALARGDKRIAFGFSREVCKELVSGPAEVSTATEDRRPLDLLEIRFDRVAQAILDNRMLIEADRLITGGFGFESGNPFVDALASLARMAGRATLETGLAGKDLFLSLDWRPDLELERKKAEAEKPSLQRKD